MTKHVSPPATIPARRTAHLDSQGNLLPLVERQRRLMRMKLPHAKLDRLSLDLRRFEQMSAGALEGICFAVPARSGMGKTQIVKKLRKQILEREALAFGAQACRDSIDTQNGDWRPVLRIEMPSEVSVISLAEALLHELKDPEPETGTKATKQARVRALLEEQKVRIILFDETQHLVDTRTEKFAYKAADWLKSQILNERDSDDEDEEPAGFFTHAIFFGTPAMKNLFKNNGQLQRRCRGIHDFKPYNWLDIDERKEFVELLANIDFHLPFPKSSCLSDPKVAYRVHAATDAVIGRIMGLIQTAGTIALDLGESCIPEALLSEAFEKLQWGVGSPDFQPRSNPWLDPNHGPGFVDSGVEDTSRKTRVRGKSQSVEPTFQRV
ncbi:TniB family NTP-binding protein [Bosea thiooxidans]